ncbi:MAG: MFS transporter [Cyanobacteria bacterium SZAS LIN-3]|nr:MFS transporter [Cyanobacteria bacterium SZAS LIN-3]MBS2010725.1 MFS transporter [Cyanobacteria bacterium SZAS TMP-1]
MKNPNPPPGGPSSDAHIKKFVFFLALVYIAEGLCQAGVGLIHQPLSFYLKSVLGMSADRATEYLTVLAIPWVIKPVFGLISDFLPLFGYRRKTYLFLTNALAAGAYLWITGLTGPDEIIVAMMLTSIGMAASSTICGALMVENGKRFEASGTFVNHQWMWYFIANIVASIGGGWLCGHLDPTSAFHTAGLLVAVAPVGVMATCCFFVVEEKARINVPELKKSSVALLKTFNTRVIWVVGAFLFFFNFNPSFGTPLFYHMTDDLHFSQEFIGSLGAIGAVGSVLGSFLYMWLQKRMTLRSLLNLSIVIGALSQLSFYFLDSQVSAVILNLVGGVTSTLALVSSLTLAADYCPDGSEGFSYALLMSISNFAGQLSMNVGAKMYEHVFHQHINPLIFTSAGFTLFALLLVPMLRLGNKMPGEKVKKDDKPE